MTYTKPWRIPRRADLIVTSGGASVGPADHLARLISGRGCLEFWKLDMRPGKPVGFGDIDDCPVLAVPGSPFAAAATFHLIGQLSGDMSARPGSMLLPLALPVTKRRGYLQVLAGRIALYRQCCCLRMIGRDRRSPFLPCCASLLGGRLLTRVNAATADWVKNFFSKSRVVHHE